MVEQQDTTKTVRKFAGLEIPPDLKKSHFFFLYFNTLLIALIMVIPAILQPAFLKDIIKWQSRILRIDFQIYTLVAIIFFNYSNSFHIQSRTLEVWSWSYQL